MTSRNTKSKKNNSPKKATINPAATRTITTTTTTTSTILATPTTTTTIPPSKMLEDDDGEFAGILYDTILYERAVHRLETLKKYDLPVQYEELAHDFQTAYRLLLEPKFLAQPNLAHYATYLLKSKLLTGKGVRAWAKDHGGTYEIYPADRRHGEWDEDFCGGELDEIDEEDLSDYDEAGQGFEKGLKNIGYQAPILDGGRQGRGQDGHRDMFARDYFAVFKHSQDMIAMIVAHLRKRVWYHDGSGGEIVEIRDMGADKVQHRSHDADGDGDGGDEDHQGSGGVKGVKGVKKYTRRFNGRIRRRNYERNLEKEKERNANGGGGGISGGGVSFFSMMYKDREPPTDYSESETETSSNVGVVGNGQNGEDMKRIEEAIARMVSVSLVDYTGSAKRKVQWLPQSRSEALYDWNGVNKELRLVDLPAEDAEPAFYGCLTRDIMNKYKKLVPPPDLMERHAQLTSTLNKLISDAFPGEDLKVEPFGSFVSGLLLEKSDADFCITGTKVHEHDLLNDMNHIGNVLKTKGQMQSVHAIPDALVPIVKFYDPVSRLECDLNTGNTLGVINSGLIRIYTTIDERVKPFLYMVKAICKAQGINDAKSGYLSSYALTWMGIVFLQQEGYVKSTGASFKPVLPRLQQQPFERMSETTLRLNHNLPNNQTVITSTPSLVNSKSSDMVHCRFDTNKDGRHTGSGHANPKSLARLLIEFFEFFSRRFFYAEMSIHVARAQFLPKTNKEMNHESSRVTTFRVVDPFLHHRNLTGTCRGETLGRVWRAFDHSYRMLSAGDLEGAMVVVE
ncbi:hypothetical protein BGX33_001154 [Mortierella sp. NVP41]|nr:hypothetical protein BGX33_001154 [Mortierella sp. NVP41]